ncbi:MAG: hypothetical protein LBG06_04980 [Deltaproteobacteria bacterium]|nr:hypothetical protein [Deltaproteobacteria bacterium]
MEKEKSLTDTIIPEPGAAPGVPGRGPLTAHSAAPPWAAAAPGAPALSSAVPVMAST